MENEIKLPFPAIMLNYVQQMFTAFAFNAEMNSWFKEEEKDD